MTRFEDWPVRLADAVAAAERRPFAWGSHDCGLFACDVRRAITGDDAGVPFRGRYATALGSELTLRRFVGEAWRADGTPALEQAVAVTAQQRGLAEIPPARAQRGDWALFDFQLAGEPGPRTTLAVVGPDPRAALFPGADGLMHGARPLWRRAWRV